MKVIILSFQYFSCHTYEILGVYVNLIPALQKIAKIQGSDKSWQTILIPTTQELENGFLIKVSGGHKYHLQLQNIIEE